MSGVDPAQLQMLFQQWQLFFQQPAALTSNPFYADPFSNTDLQQTLGASFLNNQSSSQRAYTMEVLKMQISQVLRQAQIDNQEVADFAAFQDPSLINLGPAVQMSLPFQGQSFNFTGADGENINVHPEQIINLDGPAQLVVGGDNPATPEIEQRSFYLMNKLTGNGFFIQDGKISSLMDGKVVKTASLQEVFNLGENENFTINLENGVKLTFKTDGSVDDPSIQNVYVTHPDGSFYEGIGFDDPEANPQFNSGVNQEYVSQMLDLAVQDGTSVFTSGMDSLWKLDQGSTQFQAVFGTEQALAVPLVAASFGGNVYNFFWSQQDMGWHAQPALNDWDLSPESGGFPPGFPGFDPGNCGDGLPQWGSYPVDGPVSHPPGLCPPPGNWLNHPAIIGAQDPVDLIFEDLTGIDKSGTLEKAKKDFLKHKMNNGRMDMEAKLMILLYLFIDENGKEIDDLMKKLSGVDSDFNEVPQQQQQWNERNIHMAPIKIQYEFWSQYKPNNLSNDPNTRNQQRQDNSTMVNGKLQGLQIDQALLMTRLTSLIRDRQRFIDTVTNAMKALDDALANAVRRIV